MVKLNFVLILALIQFGGISSMEENKWLEDIKWDSCDSEFMMDVPILLEEVCFSIDECKLECCQLNKIHSIATNRCTTDIEGQISDMQWQSLFSTNQKLLCQSFCPESIIDEEKLKVFINATPSGLNLCNNFTSICCSYSAMETQFKNLDDMDVFRRFWLPNLGVMLSILFLSFTLVPYMAVPELRRRIQDKCFLFHLTSHIIACSVYLIIMFSQAEQENFICRFYAFMFQFSQLASSFWLNVICFHLWRCILSVIPPYSSSMTIRQYSLYAFGSPLLVTVITHLADYYLPKEYESLRPLAGETYCMIRRYNNTIGSKLWLQPMFIYFYSIRILIQIINLIAFLHIAYIILSREVLYRRQGNETLRRHTTENLGILIFLKLFLLMGLVNILDLMIFHYGRSAMEKHSLEFLCAFLIFLIFVCNKRVFHLTKKRVLQLKSSGSTVQNSTSSRQYGPWSWSRSGRN